MDDGLGIDEDGDKDGAGVSRGGGAEETGNDDTAWGSLDGDGVAGGLELPEGSWRLCSQCRFSSTS